MGCARRGDAVGDAVRPLGVPPRLVGWLRGERPRADPGGRGSRPRPSRRRPWRSSRSCTATRWSPTTPILHTRLRARPAHAPDAGRADAKAVFFGASYHADYATVLAASGRPAGGGGGAGGGDGRARRGDRPGSPARRGTSSTCAASAAAIRRPTRWPTRSASRDGRRAGRVVREREEVCPVVTFAAGMDFEAYLGTLGQEGAPRGAPQAAPGRGRRRRPPGRVAGPARGPDGFIDLHQRRWGAEGLFPPTAGGDQSRAFFRRLFELFGGDGTIQLALPGRGRTPDRGRGLVRGRRLPGIYYNAGVDPEARELSPGVLMVERDGDRGRARSPDGGVSTSCAATSPTSTSGARSTSQSSACSSCEQGTRDERPASRRSLRQAADPAAGPWRPSACASSR